MNTDSKGNVYVFWDGTDSGTRTLSIFMTVSSDGGKHFDRPATVVTQIEQTGLPDPASGDITFDGVAGARDGTFPTVDIANGAPTAQPARSDRGATSSEHRQGTPAARARTHSADYAFATNDFVVAVWNDARNAADCTAIDTYRQQVADGTAAGDESDPTRPAPAQACPAAFGNSDIYGGSYADPTP